jgi:hypothetical protein
MMSWREGASQAAQDDLDLLLDKALPFAVQMLEAKREFYPYAAALETGGEIRMIAADTGDEHPESADVLRSLVSGMRAERDELRAIALVSDVRRPDSDAVRVELEHREGLAIAVFLPYTRRWRRGLECGALSAQAGLPQVWEP